MSLNNYTHDVSPRYGEFECEKCGCTISNTSVIDNGGINFCPDCGLPVEQY